MQKFVAILLFIFAGGVIWRDVVGIHHNAQMPWDSFWNVLFVASPAYVFEIVLSLALIILSYCCLLRSRH